MKLDFKQGIVKYPFTGPVQSFLNINGTTVNLDAANGVTLITFTHGNTDYLYEENVSISGAWQGPFAAGTDYWIYWDISLVNGLRTFGHTIREPLIGSNRPTSSIEDQHFFDTSLNKMFVWISGRWVEKARVFAAQYNGITFTSMGLGLLGFPFAGTQAGITGVISLSGNIVFDEFGKPVKQANREFFTSESQFFVSGSRVNSVRLESTINFATANEIIPEYHVVKYIGDSLVELADYNDIETTAIAISTEDIVLGGTGNLIINGIVSNIAWTWQNIGVNLWVSENGELTETDPNIVSSVLNPIKKPPVGRVLSSDTIVFLQGMGGIGEQGVPGLPGTGGGSGSPAASTTVLGISKLTVPAITPTNPIVVGDNDPRNNDARTPLAHVHPANEVTFAPFGTIIDPDVQAAISTLETNKLPLTGGTLSNFLTLHANPVNPLHAAPKQYVDNLINGLIWVDPVFVVSLIDDTLLTPSVTPLIGDTYILPSTGTPLGGWGAFANGDILQWDGTSWNLLVNISSFTADTRFGIAFNVGATPAGSFVGQKDNVGVYDFTLQTWSFLVPINNNALYINNETSFHGYHQFAYNSLKWVEFAGPHGSMTLPQLTDVIDTFPGLANGDVLTYNFTSSEWENTQPTPLFQILDADGDTIVRTEVTAGSDNDLIEMLIPVNSGNHDATTVFTAEHDLITIKGPDSEIGSNVEGARISVISGTGDGTGSGGRIDIITGNSGNNNDGGAINLFTGSGEDAGNFPGTITLKVGTPVGAATDAPIILDSVDTHIYRSSAGSAASILKFREGASNGSNYVGLTSPASVLVDRTWVLPVDDPAVVTGQFLTTDATGNLSFAVAGSGLSFPLLAPNGTISDPSYSFLNQSTSGMWLNGTKITLQGAEVPATGGTLELSGGLGILPGLGSSATQTHGGDVIVKGGMGDTTGGDVILQSGLNAGGTSHGNVHITPASPGGLSTSLIFFEDIANGTGSIALRSPNNIPSPRTWILPQDDPNTVFGQFLTTNAAGVLSFAAPAVADPFRIRDADGDTLVRTETNTGTDNDTIEMLIPLSAISAGKTVFSVGSLGFDLATPNGISGNDGVDFDIDVGDGSDNGAGGNLSMNTGSGGSSAIFTANGGDVTILTGSGGGPGGRPGNISIKTGIPDNGGVNSVITLDSVNTEIFRTSGTAATLRFREASTNGSEYIEFVSPQSVATSRSWVLPQDDPSTVPNQVLTTDSSGVLSFKPEPYDLFTNFDQALTLNDKVFKFLAIRPFVLSNVVGESKGAVEVVSDNVLVFTVTKNAVSIGTIDFAISTTTAVYNLNVLLADRTFAAGDKIEIELTTMAGTAAENLLLTLSAALI